MSKLVLAPLAGGANLRDYLASNLYLPVEPFVITEYVDLGKIPALQSEQEQQRYLMALGAGLRHEEKVP